MSIRALALSLCLLGLGACGDGPADAPPSSGRGANRAELNQRLAAAAALTERLEAVRAVKRLQHAYGHYSELGLWHDFADLFSRFGADGGGGARFRENVAMPGQDFEVPVEIGIEDAYHGTTLKLQLSMPEYDASGRLRRVPHPVKARIPPGAVDGQRLDMAHRIRRRTLGREVTQDIAVGQVHRRRRSVAETL